MNRKAFRRIKNLMMISLCFLALIIALIPLISILWETVTRGAPALNLNFIFQELPPLGQAGGGIGPAIEGTLVIVGLASLIGVPIGVVSGIFLAEFPNNRLASVARFFTDVLTNMPSIVIGILGWALIVIVIGWSVLAGAVALAIMMIPIVTRTTEEAIKLVPASMREAAIALGIPQWKASTTVVLSSAKKGIATGALLAVARISGETAPLLLTILGSRFWLSGLTEPATALPLAIYNFSGSPYGVDLARAWGASLILILIVLSISVVVRYFTREKYGGANR
ncbi:MAG: phosphate ABC transporter permease PstA [Promethearchaeati archaeon SRVP18_Atabeyarchaeia-1]